MPSVAVLGLNRFGEQVYNYLTSHQGTDVIGIFTEESQYSVIETIEPDYLVSAGFDDIIPERILEAPSEGAINLHPSYLPYNRGVNPDVWGILRHEPAGVSIHYMTPEMDAGPIIAQEKVEIRPNDTARTLRERLDTELVSLFEREWKNIHSGAVELTEQDLSNGTRNVSSDFERVCELDLDETMAVGAVLDTLRALTFPPYQNAYFTKDGARYYVRISIEAEDDGDNEMEKDVDTDAFEWNTPTLF